MKLNSSPASILANIILFTLLAAAGNVASQTLYVSDELNIPLRSGDSMQHRILSFLTSGASLQVLETNADGSFHRVNADGKEGWVKAEYMMTQPSARSQLANLYTRVESLKSDIKREKASAAELNASIRQLEADRQALEKNRDQLSAELDKLKKIAARPAAIAQQNRELDEKLADVSSELELLKQDNDQLRDRDIKEWFIIGAGVSLASLFFGLVIPNIKWRRKRDNWGGGF